MRDLDATWDSDRITAVRRTLPQVGLFLVLLLVEKSCSVSFVLEAILASWGLVKPVGGVNIGFTRHSCQV